MNKRCYISLGSTCSVAQQLRNNNLAGGSLPFDWIRTPDFTDILKLIANRFKDYLTDEMFQYKMSSDKFVVRSGESEYGSAIYTHKLYNIGFYHDFRADLEFREQYDMFKLKQQRRIERLYNLLESEDEIVFIRDDLKPHRLTAELVNRFIEYMSDNYPRLKFKVILIAYNPKGKALGILNYKHPLVTIYNDTEPCADWVRPNVDWEQIFR